MKARLGAAEGVRVVYDRLGAMSDEALGQHLVSLGATPREADLMVALVPHAFGRALLAASGARVDERAVLVDVDTRRETEIHLPSHPIFQAASRLALAMRGRTAIEARRFEAIARLSAEMNAVTAALQNGSRAANLMLGRSYIPVSPESGAVSPETRAPATSSEPPRRPWWKFWAPRSAPAEPEAAAPGSQTAPSQSDLVAGFARAAIASAREAAVDAVFDSGTLRLCEGRLAALVDLELKDDGRVHVHVNAELLSTAAPPLTSCVMGTGRSVAEAAAQAGERWMKAAGSLLVSLVQGRPMMGATAIDGSIPGDRPGVRGYRGPVMTRGWKGPGQPAHGFPLFVGLPFAIERPCLIKATLLGNERGWTRHLEIDGHVGSYCQENWIPDLPPPSTPAMCVQYQLAWPEGALEKR